MTPDRPRMFVVNPSCRVQRSGDLLDCVSRATLADSALLGVVAAALVGSAYALVQATETTPLLRGMLAGILSAVAAMYVIRRIRSLGRFTVDRARGVIVHDPDTPRARTWRFEEVQDVVVRSDGFDLTRVDLLPASPCFVELHTADGTRLRIARGSADEVQPLVDVLALWGLGRRGVSAS